MELIVKTLFPDAKLLTSKEAPGILDCVSRIARDAGCSAPPVYLTPNPSFNAAIYPAGQSMILFQGAINQTGSKLHSVPTPKLEAVLAHEMGHWKNGFRHFGPMLGIIAGTSLITGAAVYMYDRTQKQQKKDKDDGKKTSFSDAFSKVTTEMGHKSLWQNFKEYYAYGETPMFSLVGACDTSPGSWGEYLNRQVKGLAANAAGFAAALPLCRPLALRNEFEADAFAAKIVGTEVYIDLLNSLHGKVEKPAMDMARALGNEEAGKKVAKAAGNWFTRILNETIMAHPSWEERVAAVRKLVPSVAKHLHH